MGAREAFIGAGLCWPNAFEEAEMVLAAMADNGMVACATAAAPAVPVVGGATVDTHGMDETEA